MIKKEESYHILFAIIVLTFAVVYGQALNQTLTYITLFLSLIFISIILVGNILTKKISAYYFESELYVKIWMWERYGFKRHEYLNTPIPLGILLSAIIALITKGFFIFMAVLESDAEGTSARASKRHGIYRFTELTENNLGMILASGVVFNLLLAVFAYLADLSLLGRWSIFYAAYSLLPFGSLDGTKIFFGNRVVWFTLAVITSIFLSYVLFLP
ncbi:MAG: hypothetical protein QXI33_00530 [Candidatus Pacearchaeota archaeon]